MLVLAMEFSRGAPHPVSSDDGVHGRRERPAGLGATASRKKRHMPLPQNGTVRSGDHAGTRKRGRPRRSLAGTERLTAAAGYCVSTE
jgi:hypothetical protein